MQHRAENKQRAIPDYTVKGSYKRAQSLELNVSKRLCDFVSGYHHYKTGQQRQKSNGKPTRDDKNCILWYKLHE